MKKIYYISAFFLLNWAFAQTDKSFLTQISNSEKHAAAQKLNMRTNANTQNYDITYHKLEFTVDPTQYYISGKVTTTYTALANMNTLTFDLSNSLTVSTVKMNGAILTFTQNTNNELVINLLATQPIGTTATVEINYAGAPPQNGFFAFTSATHNGTPVIYTLSEPFGARDWWPCKQDLNDKVNSIDVYITAPSQYVSVSNGVEPEAPVVNGSLKTTHFHHGYPIPAYLIAIAVTNYSVYTQTAGTSPNQYPSVNYIYPENLATIQPQLDQTPLILNLYESLFEVYPFHNEKYGHAQFGWGGGMEHTTVSFMVGFDRQLIAHEMAHQWFGDKITCGTWKDIWLNEGFATYVAALVIEHFDGIPAFITEKTNMVNYITSAPNGNVYLNDSQALDVNRIFSGRLTYDKGAMVLEMLRFKLGDAVFFQGLKNYLADTTLAYGYAITSNLQTHLEAVYGNSLTEFFNDWVYNQGFPSYTLSAQTLGNNQVQIQLSQTQSDASVTFFEMPVPIRVTGINGELLDLVLQNTTNNQVFIENIPFEIADITIDPDVHLITNNNAVDLHNVGFVANPSIQLFPNPTTSTVTLSMPNLMTVQNIDVFNTLGQRVLTSSTSSFSVVDLAAGMYTLSVATSQGTFHKKFIKK